MSQLSPVRRSRRGPPQRGRGVREEDGEDLDVSQGVAENLDTSFTPADSRTAWAKAKQCASSSTLAQPPGQSETRLDENRITRDFQTDGTLSQIQTTNQKPVRRTRHSVRASRNDIVQIATDLSQPLPTPDGSVSPERDIEREAPLKDITRAALNAVPTPETTEKPSSKQSPLIGLDEKSDQAATDSIAQAVPTAASTNTSDQPTPRSRIVITYLVLTNFKSYAGTQRVGPFHSSFSSVVGPNGSGKSNVIDSLLFVFGFRASKMRQGKISALIHNSSAFPDLDYCEVEVHFQEVQDLLGDHHEVLPDSRLVISRRAFKNNSSKYYINARESNFTTVTGLLRDRGVDLDHKRFLILQGEVESIAQMKPKAASEHDDGLLEYLEDIIGTSKYKTPIEEAAAETESLNEGCLEMNGRVQHVEKEKKGLEGKKEAALTFIKDENQLSMKQSALYQVYVGECEDNIAVTGEAVDETQRQLENEMQNHRGSEEVIKSLQKQHKAEMKQLEHLDKETRAKLEEVARLDKDAVKFDEKKKHLNTKTKKLEKSTASSKVAIAESSTNVQNLTQDLKRNQTEVVELEKKLSLEDDELSKIRDSLSNRTQGLSDQINSKQKSLEPWTEKINERESEIAVARSELDMVKEKSTASAQDLTAIGDRLSQLQQDKEAKLADFENLQAGKVAEGKKVEKQLKLIDNIVSKEPNIRLKLTSARQNADEARASLSKAQTQGNVLTGLMRLKDSGRINGFRGRLGNLGTIDEKYDVAISTACPALDNLVVDSVEVGQQCIEYLRKNNLGRANFILLNRLNYRDMSEMETPEGVPRLFDLINPSEDKFKPAFFSVLQNTLVATDLEQANRIAYGPKRWRVVTLDGQLIDKSGTMSGGGTKVAKGSMSSKITGNTSKEQVAKLEKDQNQLEEELQALQHEKRDAEAALKEAQNALPDIETAMQRIKLEIESMDRNIADALKRKRELDTAKEPSKSDELRCAELASKIHGLEDEVLGLQQHTGGIQDEINMLQDKIMEVGGVKFRGQKAKVDGLRGQIETLTEEISNMETSLAKVEKQKTKHEKLLLEGEVELQKLQQDLQTLEEEGRNQLSDIDYAKKLAEEAQDAFETRQEEIQAVKIELDQKTSELNESRALEIETRNKLEENKKTLAENQRRLAYWQEKLGKLSLHKLSDLGEELEPQEFESFTKDELADLDKEVLKGEIAFLEEKTQNVSVDLDVLAEYRKRAEEHESRSKDLADAVATRDAAKKRCEDLRRLRLEGFMEGFNAISLRLKQMYQMITMGGNAELELVDSLDPFSEGILFSVMPPKKSWKNISNLSGGEKTLSSLALVFALHHYKPTPLYVMDEIDAALDFRNVSIVAAYIKERTKNAQFIVISLRNNMFELASRLVGVYKVNHMTKSVTVENKDYILRQ